MPVIQKRDDRYKWAIRDAIMANLFTRMEQIHSKEVFELATKNCGLTGYSHKSFLYNGQFYNCEPDEGPPVRQRLHKDLVPEAKKLQEEFGHTLEFEKAMVTGYLSSMLSYSPFAGDYLALLPSALHGAVKQAINTTPGTGALIWSQTLSSEKIASFKAKYQKGYELICQRMALNLIL